MDIYIYIYIHVEIFIRMRIRLDKTARDNSFVPSSISLSLFLAVLRRILQLTPFDRDSVTSNDIETLQRGSEHGQSTRKLIGKFLTGQ